MESRRKPNEKEKFLLSFLINKAKLTHLFDVNNIWVESMNSGMGSLKLFYNSTNDRHRVFGKQVSDVQFVDVDGVDVIASLYLDNFSDLFELDIWKTDFSQLLEISTTFDSDS